MKRVSIIVVFILACLYDLSAQQWGISHVQHSRSIYSIVIADPQNITISGGNDYTDPIEAVYHSTDFGLNWPENPTDTISFCVRSIAFADTIHGFGTGFFGHYVHTTDGGYTWTRDTLPINRNFFKAIDVTPSIAFLAGGEELGSNMQTILKSTDGAASWTIMRDTAGPVLRSIYFIDSLRGTAIGDSGTILRTIDGGNTWTAVAAPVQLNFNSISFINADTGYIVGGIQGVNAMRAILRTIDGGATWTILMNQQRPWFADISFLNKDTGYIVGDSAAFLQSTDGGQSWAPLTVTSANGSESFTSVRFYDRGFGIIGSLNGAGVFVYANPPIPAVQTCNVVFGVTNSLPSISLTGLVNTHGRPANVSFIIGTDSLFTSFAETPWQQTITSTSMVPSRCDITSFLGAGTYYFACKVTNTNGSYYGDTVRFTIPGSVSTLNALPYTNAGITSLTLNGQVSKLPVGSNIYIEYLIGGDTVIHTIGATPPQVNDTLTHSVNANVSGIIPMLQYQYRVKATNGSSIFYSDYLPFMLYVRNYIVNTSAATNVSADSATLQGQVSDLSFPSTIWFEYLLNGVTTTVPAVPSSVNDTLLHNVSARIGGLTPDSLYQFRMKVLLDSSYPVYSSYNSFYASNALAGNAIISTYPPSNVTANSATLKGGVGGILGTATVWFEYSQNGVVTTVPAVPGSISDSFYYTVSAQVSGLIVHTLYQYRVKVIVDTVLIAYGNYNPLYTFDASHFVVVADSISNIYSNSATVYGHVSDISVPGQLSFIYWGGGISFASASASPGYINDTLAHIVTAQLTGLAPNTSYNCNLFFSDSSLITKSSNILQFNTGSGPVTTKPATNITLSSATLNGYVSFMPLAVSVYFEYWASGYPTMTVTGAPSTIHDALAHDISAQVSGLVPNTSYEYRLKLVDSAGGVYYGDSLPVYIGTNTIPNPDFENWSWVSGEKADGWNSMFGPSTKVSPGSSGNYAAYLANTSTDVGIIMNAIPTFSGPDKQFVGGFPYAARPDTLSGMFKYNFIGTDSGFVMVIFKSQGQVISQNSYLFSGSSPNNFQQLKFPIAYTSGAIPDTLIMSIAAFDMYGQASPITGCWLIADDLSFGPNYPSIPNGGFENWHSYTYKNLDDWSYINMINFDFYPNPDSEVVIQTTDAEHGLYAAEVTNVNIQGEQLRGSVQSNVNMFNSINSPAFPLNHKVQALNGYYKFYPANGDTMSIECDVYKSGVQIGVGYYWLDQQSQSTYTPFNVNINYSNNQVPDSCFIIFKIGSDFRDCTGTWLLVDNLSFDGFVSNIEEVNVASSQVNSLKIFPNPSSSLVRIQSSIDMNGRLEIYDMQGMLVLSDRFTGNNQQLDTRNFNPGIYLVRVISGESIMSQRMVIIK